MITRRSLVQATGAAVAVLALPVAASAANTPRMNLTQKEKLLVCQLAALRDGKIVCDVLARIPPSSYERVKTAHFITSAATNRRFWIGYDGDSGETSMQKAHSAVRRLNKMTGYDYSPFIIFGSPEGSDRVHYTLSQDFDPKEFVRVTDAIVFEVLS